MPTIEIASINSSGFDINQADFDIAIIEESKLESHRGLFYDFLLSQDGAIIHLGNPNFKDDKEGLFFGGQIIDWDFAGRNIEFPVVDPDDSNDTWGSDQAENFKFIDKYKMEIDRLIKIGLNKSPVSKIYFLTDYQFGPGKEKYKQAKSLEELWNMHDRIGLTWNTLYEINE